MSYLNEAEDRATEALRFAVRYPDAEAGVNLRDAVVAIGDYILARIQDEQDRADIAAFRTPTPTPDGPE